MDCCDPAVTRSWRLFRKRSVHIQENCSDFSPRLYVQEKFLGEESLGGKCVGEKYLQEEFLGEESG